MQRTSEKQDASWTEPNIREFFLTAFGIVFTNGVVFIEKSFNKDDITQDFDSHYYSINLIYNKELKNLKKKAKKSGFKKC